MTTITGTAQVVNFANGMGAIPIVTPVSINVLDPDLIRAPTSVQVAVGNADPDEALTFTIDGTTVWTDVADSEGYLVAAIPVPGTTMSGTHTVAVTAAVSGTDSDTFTVAFDPPANPVVRSPDANPVLVDGSEGRWVFQDLQPGGLGSWVLPINPTSMTSPFAEKQVAVAHTTAGSSGIHQLAVGPALATPWRVVGYCPDETFYNHLKDYEALPRRIYVIDQRGRAWTVAIESIAVETRRRQNDDVAPDNDWAGNWTMQAYILDETPKVPA